MVESCGVQEHRWVFLGDVAELEAELWEVKPLLGEPALAGGDEV
jgi:hypothetical protein